MLAPSRIPIHLTHSNPVVEAGLQAVLCMQPEFELVGATLAPHRPQVVITDHQQGVALLQRSAGRTSPSRVLVIEAVSRGWSVRCALQSGVLGYAAVDCPLPDLVHGVLRVERGGRFLCASASQAMADAFAVGTMTARELDVLRLLGVGMDNKTIARRLDIALGTVKTHVKALLEKLNASSRTEAAIEAMRLGVIDLSSRRA